MAGLNHTRVAKAVIDLSLDELRSCGKKLISEDNMKLAKDLLNRDLDLNCKATADRVRAFASSLEIWRKAREFFVLPNSSLDIFCGVLGLDTEAVRDKIRVECSLPFNTKLTSEAASEFMQDRQSSTLRHVSKP